MEIPRFRFRRRTFRAVVAAVAAGANAPWAFATDIIGVQPAALDQPRVNAMIQYPATTAGGQPSDPLYADFGFGTRGFNVEAYFDTGASGVLLSSATADALTRDLFNPGVQQATYQGKPVIFQDVGVAGADNFRVSVPIHVSVAPSSSDATKRIATAEQQLSDSGDPASFAGIDLGAYAHHSGPIRAQIGPLTTANPNEPTDNPVTSDLDIVGTPLMKGRVVVMDPKPVERIFGGNVDDGFLMKTYLYDHGTPFRKATAADDPGIPVTNRTVKLSYGSFTDFTRTGTLEADGSVAPLPAADAAAYRPTLAGNPFIGPNPISPAGDATPGVKVAFNGHSATGSFLLDTGAAATMISTGLAGQLAVRIRPSTEGTDSPALETFDPARPLVAGTLIADQFSLSIGGIGGTKKVPGFYLSSLLLRTAEGNAAVDADPHHLRFLDAPVLVNDISVQNPTSGQVVTLDGIFGMNNLVASLFMEENGTGIPALGALTPGAFDWAVVDFDDANPTLKLRPRLNGDANRDGVVDFEDLVALAQNYNTRVTGEPWGQADFNGDGVVDFNDLVVLAQHYNLDALNAGDVIDLAHYDLDLLGGFAAGVPEPEAVGVLAVVAAVIGLTRRRCGGRASSC